MTASPGDPRERAAEALARYAVGTPLTNAQLDACILARDVLGLADRVEEAERERDEASDALVNLAGDHYFARAERAEALVEGARRILGRYPEMTDTEAIHAAGAVAALLFDEQGAALSAVSGDTQRAEKA